MLVSLNINDEPVGYSPPVGPAVRFTVRYNQREGNQPANFDYSNLGSKWTFDWLSYITDNPSNPGSDVKYYIMGGGTRIFTGFDAGSQTFAFQQLDQTKLTRTFGRTGYEMLSGDGTRKIFTKSFLGFLPSKKSSPTVLHPWGPFVGLSWRKIFLTQLIDPYGNAVSLSYDANLRLVSLTDTIGQVTTISYDHPTDIFKITKVTDPFGRFATFEYDASNRLIKISDVIGLTSEFTYDVDGADGSKSDFIVKLKTPYGETTFTKSEPGNIRSLETTYPDGDKDRVEYNQSTTLGVNGIDPVQSVPVGMQTRNEFLFYRNTYYWSKIAYAAAYPDYTKAKVYHWLHGRAHIADLNTTAGILESVKEPLEGRVWFDYVRPPGDPYGPIVVGITNKPRYVGRVLDDGSTQLYTYEYNGFGNIVVQRDPLRRSFAYRYASNEIDLLEEWQTNTFPSQLLSKKTYNTQHLPVTSIDAAGQMTTYTYTGRGQMHTKTNAKNETTTYKYNPVKWWLLDSIDGPLPGSSITFTYDSVSRVRTTTDESGYTLKFDYDDLDRLTKITFPDGTFDEFTYTRLDHTMIRDRAGRQTILEYNNIRQMTKRTDPLNRATLFQWCKCGALKSLTDPMGRTTTWRHDIQGRVKCKEYADGSRGIYRYENTISRLSQRIDEKLQVTQYDYNRDDTLSRITYNNAVVATPPVAFTYDANYSRLQSMTDGTGTTLYGYNPVTDPPSLGAGRLASVDGPLLDDTIGLIRRARVRYKMTFSYDELGRRVSTAINGVASTLKFDAAGRLKHATNALGEFDYTYDGNSFRKASQSYPNGQTAEFRYAGTLQDLHLQTITNKLGMTPISKFIYVHDIPTRQIASWTQQTDADRVSIYHYDLVDQLTAVSVSEGGNVVRTFGYSYDPASNRLTERVDTTTRQFSYNALNELTSIEGDAAPDANYQWDAEHRLISVTSGNQNTELTYDGLGRRVGIRFLVNGVEVTNRRFVWCDNEICEERTHAGIVSKRFFLQGMKVESGAKAGAYFYSHDHLGSIRELTDNVGNIRARYSYDPVGRRTLLAGDLEANFGFAGMFWVDDSSLSLTLFRAYDPSIGRWLSRDPLRGAEFFQGPNLYAYVNNDPVNVTDPTGEFGLKELITIAYLIGKLLDPNPNKFPPREPTPTEPAPKRPDPKEPPPKPGGPNFGPVPSSGPAPGSPSGPQTPNPNGPISPCPAEGSGYGGGGGHFGGGGSSDDGPGGGGHSGGGGSSDDY